MRRGPDAATALVVLADPHAVPLGSEPVRIDGEIVGRVTSGGYGFRIGAVVAFAYLPAAAATRPPGRDRGLRRVDRGGGRARPVCDPAGERIRA